MHIFYHIWVNSKDKRYWGGGHQLGAPGWIALFIEEEPTRGAMLSSAWLVHGYLP